MYRENEKTACKSLEFEGLSSLVSELAEKYCGEGEAKQESHESKRIKAKRLYSPQLLQCQNHFKLALKHAEQMLNSRQMVMCCIDKIDRDS